MLVDLSLGVVMDRNARTYHENSQFAEKYLENCICIELYMKELCCIYGYLYRGYLYVCIYGLFI